MFLFLSPLCLERAVPFARKPYNNEYCNNVFLNESLELLLGTTAEKRLSRIALWKVSAEEEEVKLLKTDGSEEKVKKMNDISGFIAEGASLRRLRIRAASIRIRWPIATLPVSTRTGAETFLLEEAKYMLVYMIFFGGLLL